MRRHLSVLPIGIRPLALTLLLTAVTGCAPTLPACDSEAAVQAAATGILQRAMLELGEDEVEETERGFRHLPTGRELVLEREGMQLTMWETSDPATTMVLNFSDVAAGADSAGGAGQCAGTVVVTFAGDESPPGDVRFGLGRSDDGALTATGTLELDGNTTEF